MDELREEPAIEVDVDGDGIPDEELVILSDSGE